MARIGLIARLPLLVGGVIAALLPVPGFAQDEDAETPDLHALEEVPELVATPRGIPIKLRLRSDTRFVVGSDFGTSDADLYWPRGNLQIGIPLSKRAAARLRMSGGAAIYDFDGTTNLFGVAPSSRQPFDNLYSGSLAIEARYRMTESWSLFTQGFVASRWEDGATFGDAISGGGGLAIGFRIPDRFELIVGGGLKSRLDRSSPRPYPLVDLEWMISDAWKFRIHGPGAVLEYRFNPACKIFLRGQMMTRRYRLDNRVGPVGRGTVRDRQIPVGFGIKWAANRNFRIGASVGVMAQHKIKVRNSNNDTIGSISSDPAPYFEVRIDLRP
ncbi:MAG: hypothetical protein JRE43_11875 [Deltaproteobacteria bacterium]|jgi:hypothetical protein|nr:hypothetical protein [Deltaproteobacteria bacterium]MBW2542351.1 hypothetical protein [Deltaproteobacteria bacterium]